LPGWTLSEYLFRIGRKIFRRNFRLPPWLDIPLPSLKYFLLAFFVWAVANMSADSIALFMRGPYGAIVDVRMLNFFRDLGENAAIVLAALLLASLVVQNFWCRYLWPYGALLGITSLFSPLRIVAPNRLASIAQNARRCARPPCPWTS
jgi:polyferredoxin